MVAKPTGRKPLRPSHKWEDNDKMDLKEIYVSILRNWIDSAQDRGSQRALVNVALNL
jgi:hypothetical protein